MSKNQEVDVLKQKILELEKEIESLNKKRKFGLVWEEHPEDINENSFPMLEERKELEIISDGDKDYNLLIEGDNYHSLKSLLYTHKGEIDVIYIDPPYNTGNNDFIYFDNFSKKNKAVEKEDKWRHSKWVSFMNKRLELARELLSKEGIIFISIDDNEVFTLKLLCDHIFGENNFISSLPRRTKSSGKSTNKIASNHDYVLVYAKNINELTLKGIEVEDSQYDNEDKHLGTRGPYKLNQTLDYSSLQYNKKMDYEVKIDGEYFYAGGSKEVWKDRHGGNHKNIDWVWRWSEEKLKFGLENDFIVIKRSKKNRPRIYTKTYLNATIEKDSNGKYFVDTFDRTKAMTTLETIGKEYSNDIASKELKDIFGEKVFDYPKPLNLLKTLIKLIPKNKITVLDFFAGSGTTGHAVMELNKEDDGNRNYILCTNNENNICENITYKRLSKVINGYENSNGKKVIGINENLKYYRTIEVANIHNFNDEDLELVVDKAVELLKIKHKCYTEDFSANDFNIFKNSSEFLGILKDSGSLNSFIEELKNTDAKKFIYIFSWSDDYYNFYVDKIKKEVKNVSFELLPDDIVRFYRSHFKGGK